VVVFELIVPTRGTVDFVLSRLVVPLDAAVFGGLESSFGTTTKRLCVAPPLSEITLTLLITGDIFLASVGVVSTSMSPSVYKP